VRKSTEFRRIYDVGRKIVRRGFVLFYLPNGTPDHRLGITVTRRIGKAVVRNRCKRRIRDAFRRHRQELGQVGVDCVVHARSAIGTLTGREVEEEFRRCGARIRKQLEHS
jgi:ribonuclease P protein component